MSDTLQIRRATPADADAVAEFNRRLAWESEGKRLDPATLAAGVRAVLADPHKGFYTLAVAADGPVGQCAVTFEWSDWRNGWYWWVQSVYVRDDWRRRGVFRRLFDRLKAEATADPTVIGIRLYVEHANTSARKTYAALGLEPEPYALMGLYPLPGRPSAVVPGS
jgi:GNAT superfamily N-acetyltransferase